MIGRGATAGKCGVGVDEASYDQRLPAREGGRSIRRRREDEATSEKGAQREEDAARRYTTEADELPGTRSPKR